MTFSQRWTSLPTGFACKRGSSSSPPGFIADAQGGAAKGKSKAKKAAPKPLQPTSSHNEDTRSVEDIYQKKTQLEHILLRPDTYIGSTEKQQQKMWVHKEGVGLTYADIEYVPGLYKIFDEILVNAADNKVRDSAMDTVRVEIDAVRWSLAQWC